jgi:hypothetical protein
MGYPSLRQLKFNPFLAPNDVPRHMERLPVATAMSNVTRSDKESHEMIAGQAYNRKQLVVVRYGWLAFPIALVVLGLTFLVATIIETSKSEQGELGAWKTSAMPALIYNIPEGYQRELYGHSSEGAGSSKTRRKVKLQLLPK